MITYDCNMVHRNYYLWLTWPEKDFDYNMTMVMITYDCNMIHSNDYLWL